MDKRFSLQPGGLGDGLLLREQVRTAREALDGPPVPAETAHPELPDLTLHSRAAIRLHGIGCRPEIVFGAPFASKHELQSWLAPPRNRDLTRTSMGRGVN